MKLFARDNLIMQWRCLGLLVFSLAVTSAQGRGGGGCLEQGTLVQTPAGLRPVESLRSGDSIWSVHDNKLAAAIVDAVFSVDPVEYFQISSAGHVLRVTAEHPLQIGPGIFRRAAAIRTGDPICVFENGHFDVVAITAIQRIPADRPAYNLLVSPNGTYIAEGILVHNKGCFLPDTPILRADGTEIQISAVKAGDRVLAFSPDEKFVATTVRQIWIRRVQEFAVVQTETVSLRVTLEHPFYVGAQTFKTLAALKIGDEIYAFDGRHLRPQKIIAIEKFFQPVQVFNLQTDAPNTFFASGIAVHNKGGGCFPAGTQIDTPRGKISIETLRPGDSISSVDSARRIIRAPIIAVAQTMAACLILETDRGVLRTTTEHPLALENGGFRRADQLQRGDCVLVFRDGRFQSAVVWRSHAGDNIPVFNLEVQAPHTFVADGFVVHNKGGGGFGGGYHGGSGSSGGNISIPMPANIARILLWSAMLGGLFAGFGRGFANRRQGALGQFIIGLALGCVVAPILVLLFFMSFPFAIFGLIIFAKVFAAPLSKADENLDFVYSPKAVAQKAEKTKKLLEFIAKVDGGFESAQLEETARETFLELQHCWQARAYDPMQPLLMADLYHDHLRQLQGMIRNHEVNMIADLSINCIDLVNVRYTHDKEKREFTALITASARDYYVDDRTKLFLRGDDGPEQFQEFWTFQWQNGDWRLREIEQSRESDVLKEENFFEQFTDTGVRQVYRDTADQQGPAGPWLSGDVETKSTRIERLLNFLLRTDPIWNRQQMLERVRETFLKVMLAYESGRPADVPEGEVFSDEAAAIKNALAQMASDGRTVEYRNLCVRKVELVLVRNYADNNQDEFTARISAHAQSIARLNGAITNQDEYVTPFVQYWTFGRRDQQWKLKNTLPEAEGENLIGVENIDEDSNAQQLQWYYTQTRAR